MEVASCAVGAVRVAGIARLFSKLPRLLCSHPVWIGSWSRTPDPDHQTRYREDQPFIMGLCSWLTKFKFIRPLLDMSHARPTPEEALSCIIMLLTDADTNYAASTECVKTTKEKDHTIYQQIRPWLIPQ